MTEISSIFRRDFLKFSLASGILIGIDKYNSKLLAQELNYTIIDTSDTSKVRSNFNLEQNINSYLVKMRHEGILLDNEKIACNVYDFQTRKKLVGINDNEAFQAASMMKPFVALAFFQKIAEEGIQYNSKLKQYMKQMIERSNNEATTKLMEFLGGPKRIERILMQNYADIFKQTQIVEYIPWKKHNNGQTYKNKASAADYSRFLYALWTNNFPFSNEIKLHMAHTSKGRIKEGTQIPKKTEVYNKTGTTAMLYGDMGIFNVVSRDGTKKAYSLVAIIQRENKISVKENKVWKLGKKQLLQGVSDLVYSDMKLRYDLV